MFIPPWAYPAIANAITPALRAKKAATSLTSSFIGRLSVSFLLRRGPKSVEKMKLLVSQLMTVVSRPSAF